MRTWLFLALLPLACGRAESLTLTSSSTGVAADGMSVVTLTAEVIFRDDPIPDGKTVTFSTSQPVLFATREAMATTVVGARRTGASEVEVDSKGGVARAFVQAPTAAAKLVIAASYTTPNRDVLSDSVTVTIGAPPPVAADHFGLSCTTQAVGAFVQARPEIRVTCNLTLADRVGTALPHTPLQFFVEAGELRDVAATASAARTFTYVVSTAPVSLPKDTSPHSSEIDNGLVVAGAGLIPGAVEQNPRDGLVTVLAVARGHEAFVDANGNGTRDAGEAFTDEGEPFLDVDDDGAYDQFTDPAPCCDNNGNNVVDGPNGAYDDDVLVGRLFHVLWTGELDLNRAFIEPAGAQIPAGSAQSFVAWFMDSNFNPVAANGSTDDIRITVDTTKLRVDPASFTTSDGLTASHGMLLSATFPTFRFAGTPIFTGLAVGTGQRTGWLTGREWRFQLIDDRLPPPSTQQCTADTYVVTGRIRATAASSYSGGSFSQVTTSITEAGDLLARNPCP